MRKSCIVWKESKGEISVGMALKKLDMTEHLRAYIGKKTEPLKVFSERVFTDVKEAEAWKEYLIHLSTLEVLELEMDKEAGVEKWYQR